MPKAVVIKNNGVLKAYTDNDQEVIQKLPSNIPFSVNFTKVRDPITHRRYFAFSNRVWETVPETIQEEYFFNKISIFRKDMEFKAGNIYKHKDIETGEIRIDVKSIDYETLDELEFRELFAKVRQVCFDLFLKNLPDETLREFDNFF